MDYETRAGQRKKKRRGKHLIRTMDDSRADGVKIWAGDEEEMKGRRQREIQRDGEKKKYQKALHLLEAGIRKKKGMK